MVRAIPHNSKCRYGERGAADAKPKARIILDAAKVSAASGGNSEPKQGQRSQSARGFCPRSTMRVPQPDIIEHFGNADAVPQPPERCLSRKAGIMRCCLSFLRILGILFGGFGAACASYSRGYLKSRKFRTFLQTRLDSTLKNIPRLCRGVRKTVNVNKNSCKATQGTQSLVRNIMTQNSPDIQVSGLFGLTEHTYGEYLYRSAPLYRCICSTNRN